MSGGTPKMDEKEYWNGTIPFVSAASMHETYIDNTNQKISESGLINGSKLLKQGNLLLLVRGSMLWKAIPVCYNNRDVAFNQDVKGLIPNENVVNQFLLYWLKSKEPHIKYMVTGTGLGAGKLDTNDLQQFPIYTSGKDEQLKIAHLFARLDERIATQNKIIEDLKKLKSAIIESVFSNCHYDKLRRHYDKLRLGDIGSYIRGLTYNSNDVIDYNGTLVMRSNNIVNGCLLDYSNNVVTVNKQISQEQQLQDGDVIICMANGSSALIGKSSFYDGKCLYPITVGAFCGIYRSKMSITKWLFQTNRYRRYIWNSLQGGNGAIANLNSEDILRMSFSLPDKSKTERYTKLLSSIDSLIATNVTLSLKFSHQKKYLLRWMFI